MKTNITYKKFIAMARKTFAISLMLIFALGVFGSCSFPSNSTKSNTPTIEETIKAQNEELTKLEIELHHKIKAKDEASKKVEEAQKLLDAAIQQETDARSAKDAKQKEKESLINPAKTEEVKM